VTPPRHWHIFCKVIDNYGDIGVCWRLSCDLASRGERVVLWVDEPSALAWMAPLGHSGVEIRRWTDNPEKPNFSDSIFIIESFGCVISPEFIALYAINSRLETNKNNAWFNLEYLSAESYVDTHHLLPSPVLSGPGQGLTKHFFYPGFTQRTGGLLREPDLLRRQTVFNRTQWLQSQGIRWHGELLVSLFCYEPRALGALLDQLANGPQPVKLLITAGRARAAVEAWFANRMGRTSSPNVRGQLSFVYLPKLTQLAYDELLWACDLNFVRGEDSLVRAIWAGKPFVWQIYPQDDNAHHAKLDAFLKVLGACDSLTAFHHAWSGIKVAEAPSALPSIDLQSWGEIATQARNRWLSHTDLTTQLLAFVDKQAPKNR
jgi:uncharacterized repeat protein (TIGR03837 family)